MQKILFKYLDIKGGELMLANSNLQFTNASQLNDPFDCHPGLIDYSVIPEHIRGRIPEEWYRMKEENDALNLRNETWLCSLSKISDSLLMWTHYCYNHKGICVGLNMENVMKHPISGEIYVEPTILEVQYQDIIERPMAYNSNHNLWLYQLQTKAKEWEYEQEVRLVIQNPSPWFAMYNLEQTRQIEKEGRKEFDWKEIRHYQPLTGDCFDSIYFGVNINPEMKEKIIKYARTKLNPNIKLYQMAIDENAFRLKAIKES